MIKELIYKHFDGIRLEKEAKEKDTVNINFAPSYVEKCKRQIYYNKLNVAASNPIETHSYIKFKMGDSVHLAIQDIFKSADIWVEGEDFKEVEWNGLNWIYRIDGKLNIDNTNYLIEIKTVYTSGYNSIENEAKKEHEIQLFLYMLFENIDNGIILYIGRDNGHIVEYNYTLDRLRKKYKEYFEIKIKELKDLESKIKNKIMPERDKKIYLKNNNGNITETFQKDNVKYKTDWQCGYCQWKNLCWQEELKEIKNHRFYIDGKFID